MIYILIKYKASMWVFKHSNCFMYIAVSFAVKCVILTVFKYYWDILQQHDLLLNKN